MKPTEDDLKTECFGILSPVEDLLRAAELSFR
jgi:hypothetical protein